MPVIACHLIEGYTADEKKRLAEALTDATRLVVPAPAELVTVMIHDMPASNYYRGRTTRMPAAALADPRVIVKNFLRHLGNRELDTARTYTANDFVMFFPDTGAMRTFDELIDWSGTRYRHIEKTIDGIEAMHSGGSETVVYCRGTLAGIWVDGSSFTGVRFIDRFELVDGKITKQEVWNDLGEVMRRAESLPVSKEAKVQV